MKRLKVVDMSVLFFFDLKSEKWDKNDIDLCGEAIRIGIGIISILGGCMSIKRLFGADRKKNNKMPDDIEIRICY